MQIEFLSLLFSSPPVRTRLWFNESCLRFAGSSRFVETRERSRLFVSNRADDERKRIPDSARPCADSPAILECNLTYDNYSGFWTFRSRHGQLVTYFCSPTCTISIFPYLGLLTWRVCVIKRAQTRDSFFFLFSFYFMFGSHRDYVWKEFIGWKGLDRKKQFLVLEPVWDSYSFLEKLVLFFIRLEELWVCRWIIGSDIISQNYFFLLYRNHWYIEFCYLHWEIILHSH